MLKFREKHRPTGVRESFVEKGALKMENIWRATGHSKQERIMLVH